MSNGLEALQLQEDDVAKFLAAGVHLGNQNMETSMEPYIYKRKNDGVYIINIRKTWEKLLLAARIIAGIENPNDVCVISSQNAGNRAVLKFAFHTGATAIAGRFTPGTFTNQIQKAFREPRLLIVTNPRFDSQAVTEASYVNMPVIALCNADSPLKHVDVAIPCNNGGPHSVGTMWWMLAREVLRVRGTISRSPQTPWDVKPDLYFYRDPEEVKKEEEEAAAVEAQPELAYHQPDYNKPAVALGSEDWAKEPDTGVIGGADEWTQSAGTEDWGTSAAAAPVAASKNWADDVPETGDWSASSASWG